VPLAEALAFMSARPLEPQEERLVRNGRALAAGGSFAEGEHVRLVIGGELVAVAERRGELLKPVTVIPD
jgi:hypothetical protein